MDLLQVLLWFGIMVLDWTSSSNSGGRGSTVACFASCSTCSLLAALLLLMV